MKPKTKKTNSKFICKKLLSFTQEMDFRIKEYCLSNNIESESEFVRYAINSFFEAKIKDDNLLLGAVKSLDAKIKNIERVNQIIFKLVLKTNENNLHYHAELDDNVKLAAHRSAKARNEKFFNAFREELKEDSSMFESLLHDYFTGN